MPINYEELFTRIRNQLIIGAGNRAADLERTGNWSYEARDSLLAKNIFVKTISKQKKIAYLRFFLSTWSKEDEASASSGGIDKLAIDTARSFIGRTGNCRERNGLLLVYLAEKGALKQNKISLINIYPPIDHQLLLIQPKNGDPAYCVDPWTEKVIPYDKFNEYVQNTLLDIIMENERARAQASQAQILKENALLQKSGDGYSDARELLYELDQNLKGILKYCMRAKSNLSLVAKILTVDKLDSGHLERFLEKFNEERTSLLDEYRPKPSNG